MVRLARELPDGNVMLRLARRTLVVGRREADMLLADLLVMDRERTARLARPGADDESTKEERDDLPVANGH